MVLKLIDATDIKPGTNIMIDSEPYTVKTIDISKTGKHGASKCRIEAIGIINNQKKIIVVPGHERFNVPLVDKRKAQILSISVNAATVMDLENFESFDIDVPQDIENLKEGDNVEYWDIEGRKIIKRKL
ncbi:MAG: translation initiation factor IF-5A [Candidatus Pacearchaeota archaeon]|nr:MAG: translation initiation factor IF-5A [Candidatus Pacearchaeota archaeon]